MTKQEQFFYDNAGFSYDPKTETQEQGKERCARELAAAETWACQEGLNYQVEPDPDSDESFMDDAPQEYQDKWRGTAWQVLLWDAEGTRLLASLGGCYGDSNYRRVVKAELALEAMVEANRKVA